MRWLAMVKSFLLSRWRGDAPLGTVLWRDMIVVSTALNIMTALAGIVLLASGVRPLIALTVYFGLLPWNFFLFLCVWQSSERVMPSQALTARTIAAIWLIVVIVL